MRYYYTDPLAAAWMAKHFGMRFLSDRSNDNAPDDASDHEADTAYEADCGWGKAKERKYYIHPDSLHQLEPQVEDLVLLSNINIDDSTEGDIKQEKIDWTRVFLIERRDKGSFLNITENNRLWDGYFKSIIQRNVTPFHWPEVDNG